MWLKAEFDVLMKRVKRRATADRPMLQGDPARLSAVLHAMSTDVVAPPRRPDGVMPRAVPQSKIGCMSLASRSNFWVSILAAIGVLVGAFVAGGILIGVGHTFLGIIVALAGVPLALVAWVMIGDR